jgi:hypothetical protein
MKILYARDRDDYLTWLKIWNNWNGKEIFAHPDYINLYNDNSQAVCAISGTDEAMLIYPFCLRNLSSDCLNSNKSKKCYDIISPYGYGGLYVIGEGNFELLLDEFNTKFRQWIKSHNVISEFVRFDLFSQTKESFNGDIIYNNDNVVCDLNKGKEVIWKEFKAKVRNNVRKAIKNDVQLELDFEGRYLEEFLDVYYATMDRRMALKKYYFSRKYFEGINANLKGHFVYFLAKRKGKIISADLVLISDNHLYSFLSATDSEAFQYRPNDLIKSEIINWGIDQNKTNYILGGGYKPNDSLFSYKKAFSPNGIIPFYVGKKIHNVNLYNTLVDSREKKISTKGGFFDRKSDFFPLYRER